MNKQFAVVLIVLQALISLGIGAFALFFLGLSALFSDSPNSGPFLGQLTILFLSLIFLLTILFWASIHYYRKQLYNASSLISGLFVLLASGAGAIFMLNSHAQTAGVINARNTPTEDNFVCADGYTVSIHSDNASINSRGYVYTVVNPNGIGTYIEGPVDLMKHEFAYQMVNAYGKDTAIPNLGMDKLSTCKNIDGKTFLEIYHEPTSQLEIDKLIQSNYAN